MEAAGPDPLPGQQIQLLLPTGLLLTGPAAPLVSEDLVEGSPPPPGAALPPRELPRSVGGNQTLSTARHTRMGRRRPGSNGKVGVSLHLGGGVVREATRGAPIFPLVAGRSRGGQRARALELRRHRFKASSCLKSFHDPGPIINPRLRFYNFQIRIVLPTSYLWIQGPKRCPKRY